MTVIGIILVGAGLIVECVGLQRAFKSLITFNIPSFGKAAVIITAGGAVSILGFTLLGVNILSR